MKKEKKIFVLDTSVIIYDHSAASSFNEHDVVIPITVLEELDNFKKGNDIKNFSAREFIRYIDELSAMNTLQDWVKIKGKKEGKLKVEMGQKSSIDAVKIFGDNKGDHRILNTALYISEQYPKHKIILVTKDINLRIKAKSLQLNAEDYSSGKIQDISDLYTGKTVMETSDSSLVTKLFEKEVCKRQELLKDKKAIPNHFYMIKGASKTALTHYNPDNDSLELINNISAFGIKPQNAEQAFALDAILNPNVKLVSIQGMAGTGKTLLSLAGALEQRRSYHQIYLARPIVPLSNRDLGFLPGDVNSKLNPYMEPLWDNLKFIKSQFSNRDKEVKQITDMVANEKLVMCPLAFIRGRSLSNVFFIIDEAQNLTPHEVKTIISRAGENTKIIFTGDIYQIDTPYLDSQSNGLSYIIDKLKGQELYAHITLEKGERSDLANLANDYL